jgi:hypothetical protein
MADLQHDDRGALTGLQGAKLDLPWMPQRPATRVTM